MLAVSLALFASVMTGTSDFVAGVKSRSLGSMTVVTVSQLVALFPAVALFALLGREWPAPPYVLAAIIAGIGACVSLAAMYRALVVGQMPVIMPIVGAAALIPVLVGIVAGERPSNSQSVGVLLAIIGVVFAARSRADGHPTSGTRFAAGAGLAVLAALGGGCYLVGVDIASRAGFVSAVLIYRTTSASVLAGIALFISRGRPSTDRSLFRVDAGLVAIGILEFGAVLLYAVASTGGMLSLVSVVASLYPVTTLVLAKIVLDERPTPTQTIGVLTVLVGVGLIAAG
jgi:drug/metabolite transporter (DMT)-like permease